MVSVYEAFQDQLIHCAGTPGRGWGVLWAGLGSQACIINRRQWDHGIGFFRALFILQLGELFTSAFHEESFSAFGTC